MSEVASSISTSSSIVPVRGTQTIILPDGNQYAILYKIAEVGAKAGLTGANRMTPDQAMFIILKGYSLGVDPIEALCQIYIVDGKPAVSAQLMIALANRSGLIKSLSIPDTAEVRAAQSATVRVVRRDRDDLYAGTFTMEEAKIAGLAGKKNWTGYAPQMLINRAVSIALRRAVPEALSGMYMVEEIAPNVEVEAETGAPLSGERIFITTPEPQRTQGSASASAQQTSAQQTSAQQTSAQQTSAQQTSAQQTSAPQGEASAASIIEPDAVPAPWANAANLAELARRFRGSIKDENVSNREFAALAGVERFDDYEAWIAKYPTGQEAYKAILSAFNAPSTPRAAAPEVPPQKPADIAPEQGEIITSEVTYVKSGISKYLQFKANPLVRAYGRSTTFRKGVGDAYYNANGFEKMDEGQTLRIAPLRIHFERKVNSGTGEIYYLGVRFEAVAETQERPKDD